MMRHYMTFGFESAWTLPVIPSVEEPKILEFANMAGACRGAERLERL